MNLLISSEENLSVADNDPTVGRFSSSSSRFVSTPELFMSSIWASNIILRISSGSICRWLFGKEPEKYEINKINNQEFDHNYDYYDLPNIPFMRSKEKHQNAYCGP